MKNILWKPKTKMLKKIKNFIDLDIRKKIILISKFTKINFYPNYLSTKGLSSLYTKILFNLFLFSDFLKYRKRSYNKIFKNKDYTTKKNFLVSTPSSGSTFLRLMLQSYFELIYQVGNGIPKYDNTNNRMVFAASQIESADLWNEVKIHNFLNDNEKFIQANDFDKKKFIMTRFPLEKMNLFKLDQIKPVVIFRDPYEVILSTYLKNDRRNEIEKKNVNSDILIKRIKEQKKYIFFWKSYFKEKKSNSDFLILDYSRLLSDTPNQLKRILNFYEYEINDDYIVKCAITHSKENTQNLFKEFKIYNRQRFSNVELKNNQKKLIYPVLEKNSEFLEIMKAYQEIIKKNNALKFK